MDKTVKDMNEAVISYMMSSTRQVVELNQKLWSDYMELVGNIAAKNPAWATATQTYKK